MPCLSPPEEGRSFWSLMRRRLPSSDNYELGGRGRPRSDSGFFLSLLVLTIGFSIKYFQAKKTMVSHTTMTINQLPICNHPNSGPAHVVI